MKLIMAIVKPSPSSPTRLAAALPHGIHAPVPGTHMSSVTKPEFGMALAEFLAAP